MLRRRTAGNNGREQNKAEKQTNRAAQLSTKPETNRSCNWAAHGRAAAVGFSATHRAADSKRVGAPQWCRRHTQGGIIQGFRSTEEAYYGQTIAPPPQSKCNVTQVLGTCQVGTNVNCFFPVKVNSLDFEKVVFSFQLTPTWAQGAKQKAGTNLYPFNRKKQLMNICMYFNHN